jgi:hypothetical protein
MGGKKTKINLEQLRQEIRELTWGTSLYWVLKEELTKINHWKQRARGDPAKAFRYKGRN